MAHPVEKIAEQLTLIDYDIFLHVMVIFVVNAAIRDSKASMDQK